MHPRRTSYVGILLAMLMAMAMLGCAHGEGPDGQAEESPAPNQEELEEAVVETRLQGFLTDYEKVESAVVQIEGLDEGSATVSVAAELDIPDGESLTEEEQEALMNVILSAVPQASEETVTLSWE